MEYEITFSLKAALEGDVPELTEAQMIYDGVKVSDIPKPFASIEGLATNSTVTAAGRESYEDVIRYQVGVFASDFAERLQLAEKVRTALRNSEGLPFFGADLLPTGESFLCDVSDFTPISNADAANTTYNHHGYFDVAVFILRKNGATTFTQ